MRLLDFLNRVDSGCAGIADALKEKFGAHSAEDLGWVKNEAVQFVRGFGLKLVAERKLISAIQNEAWRPATVELGLPQQPSSAGAQGPPPQRRRNRTERRRAGTPRCPQEPRRERRAPGGLPSKGLATARGPGRTNGNGQLGGGGAGTPAPGHHNLSLIHI